MVILLEEGDTSFRVADLYSKHFKKTELSLNMQREK